MKKILKVFISITLAFSMFITPNLKQVLANENTNNLESTDNYSVVVFDDKEIYVSSDLSNEELNNLERIVSTYNFSPEGTVVAVKSVTTYDFNSNMDENNFSPYVIGRDRLNIEIVVSRVTDSGYDHFKVGAIAAWNPDVIYTSNNAYADHKFAITWNHDFALVSETHTAYYSDMSSSSSSTYEPSNTIYLEDVKAGEGLWWSFPYLYTSSTTPNKKLWYVMTYTNIRKLNSSGNFNIVAEYAASTTTKTVTVGITDASVTFGGSYEKAVPAYVEVTY